MNSLRTIARIESDFPEKFGIPRQSNVVADLQATVVFEPAYRNPDALRGLEDFSHIWLIWGFSMAQRAEWSPTVRPPRLGGNTRMGVFATRAPYRPNPMGLSCVRLHSIEPQSPRGPLLHVLGADLMHGTPIYDIKPYLPYVDSQPTASGGFAAQPPGPVLAVVAEEQWLNLLPKEKRQPLLDVLAQDPRPSYQNDPTRLYGMAFAGFEVNFCVDGQTLTVQKIERVD